MGSARSNAVPALAGAAALSLALYLVPQLHFLSWPLLLLSTVVHELGHGLTALALGGHLQRLSIFPDGSGVAQYSAAFGRLASASTAAGGLLAPPLAAAGLFLASRKPSASKRALVAFVLVLLVCLALWVRNFFGVVFVAALCATLLILVLKAPARSLQLVTAFLAMQLALAAFSRADYLFTATAQTGQGWAPSDTAQIAQALLLPYWFWGGLIAALSLAILGAGLWVLRKAL